MYELILAGNNGNVDGVHFLLHLTLTELYDIATNLSLFNLLKIVLNLARTVRSICPRDSFGNRVILCKRKVTVKAKTSKCKMCLHRTF